jgi:hypothetical protein
MPHRSRRFVAQLLLTAAVPASALAQQPRRLGPSEVAAIKQEVKAASDKYFRDFSEHKMESLDESYFVPLITFGANDITVRSTREEVIKRAVDSYDQFRPEATGYLRSEMPNPDICVINTGTALVSGTWYRIKNDGSRMSESGIVYFWGKTKAGWRMVGWAGASTGLSIQCTP